MKPYPSAALRIFSRFLILVLSANLLGVEVRQFKDVSGRVISGTLVDVSGDNVMIKREDGQSFILKASSFSAADQAYFKQAMENKARGETVTKKGAPPTNEMRDFPFCATLPTVKLNPKMKEIFDELKVTKSDRIRIYGKKRKDSAKVDGSAVYHNGKLALFPALARSGKIIAKLPSAKNVRRHFVVLETGNALVAKEVNLGEETPHGWILTQEGGNTVLSVVQDAQTTIKVSAPTAQVTGAGFAATARWIGDEVDTTVIFD